MPTPSVSVAGLDEDVITMGATAAITALDQAHIAGQDVACVIVATSSSPYVVKSAAAVVADYIGAGESTTVIDVGSGPQAGMLALLTALQGTSNDGPTVVVAADACSGLPSDLADVTFGAGATAFVVGSAAVARLIRRASRYSSTSNVWQASGQRFMQRYDDDRFERTVGHAAQLRDAVARLVADGPTPDWYALTLSGATEPTTLLPRPVDGSSSGRIAGRDEFQRTGDTGCANALTNLRLALDAAAPGETIAAVGYGAGAGTVAALFEKTGPAVASDETRPVDAPPVELSYVQFAKHRGHLALPSMPSAGAPFAASPAWERGKHFSVGLRGLRCRDCRSLNFPERHYCLDCRGQRFDDVPLPRTGTIVTFNLQHIVPIGPEEAPLAVCTVLLDGEPPDRYGGKVAALLTDGDLERVQVGMAVELVPRRGDVDDGLVKYGWKFRPIRGVG